MPASSERASRKSRSRRRSASARDVRLLVLDVDGVLTDGRLWFGREGEELKVFHVHDGHGIRELLAAGIEVAILSKRRSQAVERRCLELGVRHVLQGIEDKAVAFARLCNELRLEPGQCACVGDDVPDVPLLRAVGIGFAVADAHPAAIAAAHHVTRLAGGRGAVREVCDRLLAARRRPP